VHRFLKASSTWYFFSDSLVAAASDREKLQASSQKPVAKVEIKEVPTLRSDQAEETPVVPSQPMPTMMVPPNPNWNNEQQIALEGALRKFPASAFTANPSKRWDAIAELVPGKASKDIKARMKELAEFAKTKKK